MRKKKFLRALASAMAAVMLVTSATPVEAAAASEKYQGGVLAHNGFKEISDNWFTAEGGWDNSKSPNAIDPTIFEAADGKMYMVYGSWSGGLFILEVDRETGQAIYPGVDGTEPTSGNRVDRYFGTHIAGGNHQSGEAPFIEYDPATGYYWLYETYGGLTAMGGYNMRLFRSTNVYGPYLDAAGNNAADSGKDNNKYGVKLIGNYRFFNQPGYRAAGHNSSLIDDDGSRYLFFHQRFDEPENQTERHELRVRQQFLNEDNWPVTAVYEYRQEKIGHYDDAKVVGNYEVINHGTDSSGDMIESQIITLNADGTVSGEMTGTWSKKAGAEYDYVTITAGSVTYKGVFFEQQDETAAKNTVMTFTAIGNNNESLWGSRLQMTDAEVIEYAATVLNQRMVSVVNENITLPTLLKGADISWSSSNPSAISNTGVVTRGDARTQVTLTATFTVGSTTSAKTYTVTVAPKPSAICAYDFEDGVKSAGGTISDDAELKGTAQIVDDATRGKVLQIVSSTEVYNENYLKLPDATLANVSAEDYGYTVAMWVKCEPGIFEHSALFNAMREGTYPMTRLGVNLIGRINAGPVYIDEPTNEDAHSNAIRDGKWHHVAYSINPKGVQIWLDGKLDASQEKDLTACFNNNIQNANDVRIGSGSPWKDRDVENAMFDNVVVYNGTMKAEDIQALYASTGGQVTASISELSENNEELADMQLEEEVIEHYAAEITNRVSVHDPSIVKNTDGTYYVFGSHLADAKSKDLINWEQMHIDYNASPKWNWKMKSIYGDIINNLSGSFKWAGYDDGDCAGGGLGVWAPDVFWNKDYKWADGSTGAWMIYYCASSTWRRSCIGYAVCKSIEGPYKYVDTIIYSGFTKTGETDGDSMRDTKWDNDYLNLSRLIEQYNKPEEPETPKAVGKKITTKEGSFKVTKSKAGASEVEFTAPASKTAKTVSIPATITSDGVKYKVTKIADKAFQKNKKLTKITLGSNIKTIGKNAFDGCTKLKTVKLDTNLVTIGNYAFRGCTAITSITIPKKVKTINKNAFDGCKKLKTLKLGASVETIGNYAFRGCAAMTSVTLPKKVKTIGTKAFQNCKKLKKVTINSTVLKKVGSGAFKGIKSNATIKVPKSKLKAYKKLLKNKVPSKAKITK
ncbi:MAG: leucine-rich repeat protein [Roseburia sp.]|nr:leucine-rich repeat protein [Roseburia sp.]